MPSPSTGVPGLGTEGGWRCSVRGKHRSDPFLERPKESRARALPRPGSLADREAKEGSPALTSARGFWPSGLDRRSAGWLGRGRTALRPIRGSQAQPKEKPRWLGRLAAFGLQGPRRGSFGGLVAWRGRREPRPPGRAWPVDLRCSPAGAGGWFGGPEEVQSADSSAGRTRQASAHVITFFCYFPVQTNAHKQLILSG